MSNLIFNLRIFYWHIQLEKDKWFPTIGRNNYFWEKGLKNVRKIERYK